VRATSTVVDAAIFLVLVSAAVTTLAAPAPAAPDGSADDVAETLASSTTAVGYVYGVDSGGPTVRRTATGTHAELLGRSTVANLQLDGESITPGTADYAAEVRNATVNLTAWNDHQTRIEARWEPYRGAPLRGTVAVGPAPPATVDTSVTTLRVPVPVRGVGEGAVDRHGGGYRGVAEAIAAAVVSATLPADRVEFGSPGTAARHVATRQYRAFAAVTAANASVENALAAGGPARANVLVRNALADRIETDIRQQFDSAESARQTLQTEYAEISVVEWES